MELALKAAMPNFFGGENSDWPQHNLLYNQCRKLLNVDPYGKIRGGSKKLNTSPLGGGRQIQSGFVYYNPTTFMPEHLVQAENSLYTLGDDGSATLLPVSPTSAGGPGTLKFSSPLKWESGWTKLYFANGRMHAYDGTTAYLINALLPENEGMPQDISRFTQNLERIFAASLGSPHRVFRSPEATVEGEWDATEYSNIKSIRGDRVRDLCAIADGSVLVLSEASSHRLEGSTIYDQQKSTVSHEIGILGNTLATFEGTAIWLSSQGVVYYNPSAEKPFTIISRDKINNEIFKLPIGIIDKQAVGAFYPKRRLYLLSIPFGSAPLVFAFDFQMRDPDRGGLTFPAFRLKYPWPITSMWTAERPVGDGELYAGTPTGNVYQLDKGHTDDGDAIAWEVETAYSPLIDNDGKELPNRMKNIKHIYLGGQYHGTMYLELSGDYGRVIWPAAGLGQETEDFTDPNVLFWSVGNWNEKNWGKEYSPVQRLRVTKFNAVRVAARLWGTAEGGPAELEPPVVTYFPRAIRGFA